MHYVIYEGPTGLRIWQGPFGSRSEADAIASATKGIVVVQASRD
jgi:hypothetical protein